ncbi:MAG: Mur ligase domain-containing protein, partial [Natronospirillum sp.]
MMREFASTELTDLYPGSAVTGAAQIRAASTDTRTLQPGDAYIALRGAHFDGHEFNEMAHDHGASLLVVDQPHTLSVPQWIVPDT